VARVTLQRSWRAASTLLASLTLAGVLYADAPPELHAQLKCEGTKQIVLCTAPIVSTPGSHITYAHLNLLKQPEFLRVVSGQSTFSQDKSVRPKLKLLFVPSRAGTGHIVTELQAVVCKDNGQACPHVKRVLSAPITVR
jgi:hypothetical protein